MTQNPLVDALQPARSCPDTTPSVLPAVDVPLSGLNPTREQESPQNVYESLRNHQQAASETLRLLHSFLSLIVKRFFDDNLPLPALSWDKAHRQTLGWYLEKDGLQLAHRINLNSDHADRPLSEILCTLTHELLHEHEHIYGKPPKAGRDNYHSSAFRRKSQEIGIPCNKKGVSLGIQEPFVGFLKELGVEADTVLFKLESQTPPDKPDPRRGSHLKPWACNCTRIWASVRTEVTATCNECGSTFSEAAVNTRR